MVEIHEPVRIPFVIETTPSKLDKAINASVSLKQLVVANTKQGKRRATVDVVLEHARALVTKLHESGVKNISKYVKDPECDQYKAILLVLNTHEFVACGIREGAFDEDAYKRLRFSTLLKDWDILCASAMEIRQIRQSPTLFQDFQWLNERWQKERLNADSGNLTSLGV